MRRSTPLDKTSGDPAGTVLLPTCHSVRTAGRTSGCRHKSPRLRSRDLGVLDVDPDPRRDRDVRINSLLRWHLSRTFWLLGEAADGTPARQVLTCSGDRLTVTAASNPFHPGVLHGLWRHDATGRGQPGDPSPGRVHASGFKVRDRWQIETLAPPSHSLQVPRATSGFLGRVARREEQRRLSASDAEPGTRQRSRCSTPSLAHRQPADAATGSFTVLVPDIPEAEAAAFVSSSSDPAKRQNAARLVTAVSLRESKGPRR